MDQQVTSQLRTGGFESVAQVDRVIRDLRSAGFVDDQLMVICPPQFQDQLAPTTPNVTSPPTDAPTALATGGAVGATLGGLALVATIATGGAAGVLGTAAAVLVGGGALAGGISGLIVAKGYDEEADDYYKKAVERGWIVVGVAVTPEDGPRQIAQADRILHEAGAKALEPV